jgi:uncharacterized protein YyaL (SSP411 family)
MKRLTLLLTFTLAILCNSFRPAGEIKWFSFDEGYKLAKKKKKIMLIDVYTDWCGWCKRMDRDAYEKSEIAELVVKDFIPIKFNPELDMTYTYDGKVLGGSELQDAIGEQKISGYPATVFVHPKTSQKKVIIGYRNAEMMKSELSSALTELNTK